MVLHLFRDALLFLIREQIILYGRFALCNFVCKYGIKFQFSIGILFCHRAKDRLYKIKAKASKEIDGKLETGKEVTSDSFVIYEVKQFDTFPKIAKYYGVPLKNIMKDNQVMDALVVANNTIFIRNPQTNVPYSPAPLTDQDKMRIDGA